MWLSVRNIAVSDGCAARNLATTRYIAETLKHQVFDVKDFIIYLSAELIPWIILYFLCLITTFEIINMIKMLSRLTNKVKRKFKFYQYTKKNNIRIAAGSSIAPGVKIGRYTRINAKSHLALCEIGAFCAIAGRLSVRSSDHHYNYLNMQDTFQRNVLNSTTSVAGKSKGSVRIGNGVWIGDSVIVLSGVTIGNGAVIGAGSVVTKPIPAYSIAVGNPAKVIKYRFNEDIRDAIEKLAWWEWSIQEIQEKKYLFEKNLEKLSEAEFNIFFPNSND